MTDGDGSVSLSFELAKRGRGVYVWPSSVSRAAPLRLTVGGRRLERFMDSIYVAGRLEKLRADQIRSINQIRRPLMNLDTVGWTNSRIRQAIAAGAAAAGAKDILEWGCGYSPMVEFLPTVSRYACTDIDHSVIEWQLSCGYDEAILTDDLLREGNLGKFDAILSAFVFHFRIPRSHIVKMRTLLRSSGFILANVYRRDSTSRKQLCLEFERAGLNVCRRADESGSCARQEFWYIGHPSPDFAARADLTLAALFRRLAFSQSADVDG